ncbi:hypothetical protein EZV61_05860 [Corallincola luteus]|uniref:Nitroreductase domain-containing protein n=1 Tax=Corallincola luteus TaxID=1775177 RepID=A0ABY2AQJ1_9GAMM|nr:nitroreductase family protein [Corallincola luteus]TCI05464.1 hypothetical protein EZV61_05860 [Corallincola luteus]
MLFKTSYTADFSNRDADDGVSDIFSRRWSPRAFRKQTIPPHVLTTIFDAARWAPSCFNAQPWRFITNQNEKDFDKFLSLLVDSNQTWAKHASVIGFVIAQRHFPTNGKTNEWAQFDCGAAWMSMTLQAAMFGLYSHGMGGIKKQAVYAALAIPEDKYEVVCGFAIGAMAPPETLPDELAKREQPSERLRLTDVWHCGKFNDTETEFSK